LKHNRFLELIKSKLNPKVDIEKKPLADLINEPNARQDKNYKRITNYDYFPLRKLLFWGVDEKNNPSFLILYGNHKFNTNSSGQKVLECDVTYTDYAIFRGKEGHFPSFESVKILDAWSGNKNIKVKKMFFKKDVKDRYYWYDSDSKKSLSDFFNFSDNEKISFPYFETQPYEERVNKLLSKNIEFNNFLFINPLYVLNLIEDLSIYYDHVYEIFSNFNIHMRKKHLKKLVALNPPKKLYDLLFHIGNSELISGLFLKLALHENFDFIEEARNIIMKNITWADENYSTGVKRCASIYYNSFDGRKKQEKIDLIRSHLKDMDSNDFYKKGNYSDGTSLNINNFKNIVQEAEVFSLVDVLGKIAYYLDAPRLRYFFQGKALTYFKRYVRRILDSYAKNDEIKFMEAMKSLLTSYTNADYTGRFKDDFQFNYFIKYYLYNSNSWRHQEYSPEIWNRHLDYVIDIALNSKITIISKALYSIMIDPCNEEALNANLSYEKLIALLSCNYQPTIEMSKNLLVKKIEDEKIFNVDLMMQLMNSQSKEAHEVAMKYYKSTEGKFSAETIVSLLLSENRDEWTSLIESNIEIFSANEYIAFLNSILDKEHNIQGSEDLEKILYNSLYKLTKASQKEQVDLVTNILNKLQEDEEMPTSILNIIEEIIFSSTIDELKYFLQDMNIELKVSSMKKRLIISLLISIRECQLLSDSNIIEIIEKGSQVITRTLIETIYTYRDQLNNRFQTLLIMLESEIVVLNDIAKEVFENLEKDRQKNMHMIILDSPDKRAYSYGLLKLKEIYEDKGKLIPEEFIRKMIEHPAKEVKSFISDKIDEFMKNPEKEDADLFMYYSKAILYLPNRISKAKDNIYSILPRFVKSNREKMQNVEEILLDIGSSNVILDSERALVALCMIKKEVS